jgi:hypothetical protein
MAGCSLLSILSCLHSCAAEAHKHTPRPCAISPVPLQLSGWPPQAARSRSCSTALRRRCGDPSGWRGRAVRCALVTCAMVFCCSCRDVGCWVAFASRLPCSPPAEVLFCAACHWLLPSPLFGSVPLSPQVQGVYLGQSPPRITGLRAVPPPEGGRASDAALALDASFSWASELEGGRSCSFTCTFSVYCA